MRKVYFGNELYHHGVLGQKLGVRRYQNTDGSYKPSADGRYDPEPTTKKKTSKFQQFKNRLNRKQYHKDTDKLISEASTYKYLKSESEKYSKLRDKEKANPTPEYMTKDIWKGIDAVKEYDRLSKSYSDSAKSAKDYYQSYLDKYGKMPVGAKAFSGKDSKAGFKEMNRERNKK